MRHDKKRILFLCTGNSCRSQIAEGFMRYYFGDSFEVHSAGLLPCYVHPKAIKVMKESGIDISRQTSKPVDLFINSPFDYVITVCDHANESCPMFTGEVKNRVHWGFEDPTFNRGTEEEVLNRFREVRDLIKQKLLDYFGTLEH